MGRVGWEGHSSGGVTLEAFCRAWIHVGPHTAATLGAGEGRGLWCDHRNCVTGHVPQLSVVPAASELTPVPSASSLPSQMCKKREKRLPDATLEKYVLTVVLDTINAFFSSPFSENSTSLQVTRAGRQGEDSSSASPPKHGLGVCADAPVSCRPTRPSWCSFSSPP